MAIYELADGRRFDIPDSVPQEEAIAGLRAKFGKPDTTGMPAEQPPVNELPIDKFTDPGATSAGQLFAEDVGKALTSRETARAVGGTVGSVIGVAQPLPGGLVIGGALGAAGGDAIFNIIEAGKNAFEGQELAPLTTESVQKAFKSPLKAGKEDLIANLAFAGAGAAARGFKPLVGKAIGVATQEAKELAKLANRLDIPLGAINVTASEAVKGFAKVVGVFPFIGTPLRKAQNLARQTFDEKFGDVLNTIAPVMAVRKIGINLTKAAEGANKKFTRIAGSLYDDFLKKADEVTVKDIFPTTQIKKAAAELKQLQAEGQIDLAVTKSAKQSALKAARINQQKAVKNQTIVDQFGNKPDVPLKVTEPTGEVFGKVPDDPITQLINEAELLPERVTAVQMKETIKSLNSLMSKAAADGFDVKRGAILKEAMEKDFHNPQVDLLNANEAKGLIDSLTTANKFFSENIKKFQTATGKKFGRIDKNIFKPKFFAPGTREADEAFAAVFNSKSVDALNNLREVVGDKPFRQSVRKYLDTAMEKSVIQPAKEGQARVFDPDKFEKMIGLDTIDGRNTLKAMLKDSKVQIGDIEDFSKILQSIGSVELSDAATFLKRKATLQGLTLLTGGAAISGGILSLPGLAITLAARKGFKALSNPTTLKALTTAVDSTTSQKLQRAAILRLMRNIPSDKNQKGD